MHPLLCVLALAGVAPAGENPSVLVLGFQGVSGVSADVATLMTETTVTHLQSSGRFSTVTARSDVQDALSLEQQRQLVDCNTTSCMIEIANVMGADFLLTGTAGKAGRVYSVHLRLFSTRTSNVAAAVSRILEDVDEGALVKVVPELVDQLLERALGAPGKRRVARPQPRVETPQGLDPEAGSHQPSRLKPRKPKRAVESPPAEPGAEPSPVMAAIPDGLTALAAATLPPGALAILLTHALVWTCISLTLISNANTGMVQQATGGACWGLSLLATATVMLGTPFCLVSSAAGPSALATQFLWGRGQANMRRRAVGGALLAVSVATSWLGIIALIAAPFLTGVGVIVAAVSPRGGSDRTADPTYRDLPVAGIVLGFAALGLLAIAASLIPLGAVAFVVGATAFALGEW